MVRMGQRPRDTDVGRHRGASCQPNERPDDLDRDDHHEVGDRDRREEPEGRAPAAAPDDRPRAGRLRDDQVRDDAADERARGRRRRRRRAVRRSPPGQVDAAARARRRRRGTTTASTIATLRLAATARTTGRGALRNWRQRTSAHERARPAARDGSGRSVIHSPRIASVAPRRERLGRVRRQQLDRLGEPLELLLGGEEADADPERVEAGDRPGDREDRATRARRAPPAAGQPAIRNVTSVAIGGSASGPSRPGSPPGGRRRARGHAPSRAAWTKSSPTNIDSQPIERAIPTTDGRWIAGRTRSAGRRATRPPSPCAVRRCSKLNQPPSAGVSRSIDARVGPTRAPIPSGPSSHFWAGDGVQVGAEVVEANGIAPAAWAPSTTTSAPRSWAISAIRATGMTAPVVHSDVRDRDQPGAGRDRGLEGGERPRRRRRRRRRRRTSSSTPLRSRSAYSGPTPPGVLVRAS